MQPPVSSLVNVRLEEWVRALEELSAEVQAQVQRGGQDPAARIALLHILEDRAHSAFLAYQDLVLR